MDVDVGVESKLSVQLRLKLNDNSDTGVVLVVTHLLISNSLEKFVPQSSPGKVNEEVGYVIN